MKPYYEDDWVTLYHGDCRDVLPMFDDEGPVAPFAAAFADPPYNVGVEYGSHNDKMAKAAYSAWCRGWYGLLRLVATSVAVTPGMVSVPMWMTEIEPTHFLIAWTKANNNSRNYMGATSGYQCWEPILLYGKSRATVLRDWFDCPISLQASANGHPCPKPLRLLTWLIPQLVPEGEAIVDPFAGSGTTLRAAKDLGRKAVGIEIEERFCEIAAKRCAQEVLDFGGVA